MSLQAPAPGLTPKIRADLSAKAVAAAQAVQYVGAGTVEFIFDNDTQEFYFMEMYDNVNLFSLLCWLTYIQEYPPPGRTPSNGDDNWTRPC